MEAKVLGQMAAFGHGDPTHGGEPGMTIRQYYAGLAMQAIASGMGGYADLRMDLEMAEKIAEKAVRRADALLAELVKPEAKP